MDKSLTVFTPTYNRAYILDRCYKSLCAQTNQNFEWLIVDDGSVDDTQALVEQWQKEDRISIRYVWQENGGKQRAHNTGVCACNTLLFYCVDSDDYLPVNAVERILLLWEQQGKDVAVAGIIGLKGYDEERPLHQELPKQMQYSTLSSLYRNHGFKGDTALIYRACILKEYLFYVFEGEKFIGEDFVYDQIDEKYTMCLLNKVICVCEYLDDGYSANVLKLKKENPRGYALLAKQKVKYAKNWKEKYVNSIKYMVGMIWAGEPRCISNAHSRILAVLAAIPAKLYIKKFFN